MRFYYSIILFILVFLSTCSPNKHRISSGFEGGTYYRFAQSISALEKNSFIVLKSKGSFDNINKIARGETDLGFSQLDVLLRAFNDDSTLAKRVKILLPIYPEEVHLITSAKLHSIAELKSKEISIGPVNSGISATSLNILKKFNLDNYNIRFKRLDTVNALSQLFLKKIDGVMIVAGAPVEVIDIKRIYQNKFYLYSFKDSEIKKLLSGSSPYREAHLSKAQYSDLKGMVNTISVDSALIGRANLSSDFVNSLLSTIFNNQQNLQKSHTKWKKLNIMNLKRISGKFRSYFHKAIIKKFFK